MFTLFHHPFCPHSRFIRLALGEHGLDLRLVEERVWERREAFLALNPAGTTPVLIAEGRPPIPGAAVIAEYLDETHGAEIGERRLMPAAIRPYSMAVAADSSAQNFEKMRFNITSWFARIRLLPVP